MSPNVDPSNRTVAVKQYIRLGSRNPKLDKADIFGKLKDLIGPLIKLWTK